MKTLVKLDDSHLDNVVGGSELIWLPPSVPADTLLNHNPLAVGNIFAVGLLIPQSM